MPNEDEDVIIDNRIEVLADAMTNPNVNVSDIENIETHSDIEVLLKRAVIALKDLQISSGAGLNWGQIQGNLTAQTDLVSALSAKASLSDLAAIDTKTRNLENSMSAKADKSELDAKANVDVYAELDTKASTSWAISMFDAADAKIDTKASTSWATNTFATKADKDELDAKINGKASATMWSNIEIPASGWSASAPYTQTVTVNGMLATYHPFVDIQYTDNTTIADEKSYYSCIDRITTGANSITLICLDEKPAGTFHINLKEVS